jgi:glucose/arabinose dehydrogenase
MATIHRTGSLAGPVTITYGITADTAVEGVNYLGTGGTVVMADGATDVSVPIHILDDGVANPTQSFVFSVINADGATLVAPRTERFEIIDSINPAPPPPVEPALVSDYNVRQVPVLTGLDQPIRFVFSPLDGTHAYVAEKAGVILLADMVTGQTTMVADLSAQVNNHQDRGLLDIALDPNFAHNGYIYAFIVVDPADTAGHTGADGPDGAGNRYAQVVRLTADAATGFTTLVQGSEKIILGAGGHALSDISGAGLLDFTDPAYADLPASDTVLNPGDTVVNGVKQDFIKADSSSHDGGHLAFGPDGALYVSIGDATSFNYADPRAADVQSLDHLTGKILRIDPATGLGLPDNPFATAAPNLADNEAKVFQLGLRNPFSMAFAPDGRLFIADTGWNSYEEINTGGPGANFGWPFYEGGDGGVSLPTPVWRDLPSGMAFYAQVAAGTLAVTPAFRAFSHLGGDPGFQVQAITSGEAFINSAHYPASLQNDFIFTDFAQGEVYAVNINSSADVKFLYQIPGYAPVDFVQGPDGNVYYADLVNGLIGRLDITLPDYTPQQLDIGAGRDTLVLTLAQDAYNGSALFTVSVDGVQVGGTETAHGRVLDGTHDTLTLHGSWGAGPHTVTVNFLNDAWGGTVGADRNLHVESISYNGVAVPGAAQDLMSAGPANLAFIGVVAPVHATPALLEIGSGTDSLVLQLSQDAYKADAQYTVTVDGQSYGRFSASAWHSDGLDDTLTVHGNWGAGAHTVSVNFLNDAYDTSGDRNLHVDGVSYNGLAQAGGSAALMSAGPMAFGFTDLGAPPPKVLSLGGPSDVLVLKISQDSYLGDAQYTVSLDGVQQGGVQTASAWHSQGQDDVVTLAGNFAAGPHRLEVLFLNDKYDGTPETDRNLYVDGVSHNGVDLAGSVVAVYSGAHAFDFI